MPGRPRPSQILRRSGAGGIAGAGLSLICLLAATLIRPAAPPAPASAPLFSGARLSEAAIHALPSGIRRLLADASWIAAVQYYGNRRLEGVTGFEHLGAFIEGALRLDPGLRPAALVGPLLLAESPPLGAGEPERADSVLAEWLKRHPDDFDAVLLRGLLHHWHLDDPEEGARILALASAREAAPPWLTALAARSLVSSGAREAARGLWRTLASRADDGRTRANARTHLLQIDALDRLDALTALVRDYEQARGRRPNGWSELVAAGVLREAPLDPAGVPFVWDEEGLPRIAPMSPLAGYPGR